LCPLCLGGDYSLTLLAGALLDDVLAERLKEFFVPDEEAVDSILGIKQPLSSFSSRITMGYLLGLYGPRTRATLDQIRDIRNAFAHYHQMAHFSDPEISRVCLGLFPGWMEWVMEGPDRGAIEDPRRRFQACASFLLYYLLELAPIRPQPEIGFDRFALSEPEGGTK
jgi:hypothetical protein